MIKTETTGSNRYIMGWVATCFFGLGILVGLFHMLDKRPQIIITENGIWDRSTKQDEVKWEQIKSAYPLNIFGQKFLSLVVDDSFEIKQVQYKWAAKMNEAVGGQKINLLLSQLNVDEYKITAFVQEMIASDKENRAAIIKKYFINT